LNWNRPVGEDHSSAVGGLFYRKAWHCCSIPATGRTQVLAVKVRGSGSPGYNLLDLAMLTGGRPVFKATQTRPQDIRVKTLATPGASVL
jgi:hypothetical protein